jgi:hypothetical protein
VFRGGPFCNCLALMIWLFPRKKKTIACHCGVCIRHCVRCLGGARGRKVSSGLAVLRYFLACV